MKRFLLILSILCLVAILYFNKVFVINAAQIDVHDMDVKVIYHYEDDDEDGYEFVGYNERSRMNFEEGHIGFQNSYGTVYQDLLDNDRGKFYHVDFKDEVIESSHNDKVLELCIYQTKITKDIIDTAFVKDYIHFEFEGVLEAYTNLMGTRKAFTRSERDFKIQGDFEITGIYDEAFIDYQIKRLILYKLKYTADDYFIDFHGVTSMNWSRVRSLRYWDGIVRYFTGLPYHSAWAFKMKEQDVDNSDNTVQINK